MNGRVLTKGLVLFSTLALVALLVHETNIGQSFSPAWSAHLVEAHGVLGYLIFIAAGALFTAVGLPRQAVAFVAGYAFGMWQGIALAIAASVVGCMMTFYYARFLGREMVRSRYPERVRRIDRFLADNPFSMTLLVRFLPVGSNVVMNLVAGVSGVAVGPFFLGSAVGYLPQTVVFALIGGGTALPPWVDVSLAAVLFVLSGVIGVLLYRRYRKAGGAFDEETEHELVPDEPTSAEPGRGGA